ncbi:hypothetical protein K503DRAFT_676293, partial [Rhizopogon vinicolor AM-OR11-026]
EEIGFLDETSKDERTLGRSAGRSLKGICAMKKQVFIHGHRLSALGLLTVDGMMAVSVIEGSFMTVKFKTFIEEDVVTTLMHPISSVLVMDNAKIHHGDGVADLIREAG